MLTHRPPSRAPLARRGQAVLLWCLVAFLGGQLLFFLAKEYARPDLRDPEYGLKLTQLRQRLAERPGARPFILVLGSSRITSGFRAEELEVNRTSNPDGPLVYNFGLVRCAPVPELFALRRLLADGIRPDVVLIEFWPPLVRHGTEQVDDFIDPRRMSWADVALLRRFTDTPARLASAWRQAQLVPAYSLRHIVLNRCAPSWVPDKERFDMHWRGMSAYGWVPMCYALALRPDVKAKATQELESQYRPVVEHLCINERSDRAFRQILELCSDRNIATALLIGPESSGLRGWYPPAVRRRLADYLERLRHEFGTPTIRGQDWIPDEEFFEGVHLLHAGASTFARRFEREALPAIVDRSLWQRGPVEPSTLDSIYLSGLRGPGARATGSSSTSRQ
jgi:hypothetical protein